MACLNAAISHYREPLISVCQISYNHRRERQPRGIFAMWVWFFYSRIGPDRSEKNRFLIGKMKAFGSRLGTSTTRSNGKIRSFSWIRCIQAWSDWPHPWMPHAAQLRLAPGRTKGIHVNLMDSCTKTVTRRAQRGAKTDTKRYLQSSVVSLVDEKVWAWTTHSLEKKCKWCANGSPKTIQSAEVASLQSEEQLPATPCKTARSVISTCRGSEELWAVDSLRKLPGSPYASR